MSDNSSHNPTSLPSPAPNPSPEPPKRRSLVALLRDPAVQAIIGIVGVILALVAIIVAVTPPSNPPQPTPTPTETFTATLTDAPTATITQAAASSTTLTDVISPTAAFTSTTPAIATTATQANTGVALTSVTLVVFRSEDVLALYVPADTSFGDLGYRVTDGGGEQTYRLDDYASFMIGIDTLPQAACFVLELSNSASPIPTECQRVSRNNLFIQSLTTSDVFWHDCVSGGVSFGVLLGEQTLGLCPSSAAQCEIEVS